VVLLSRNAAYTRRTHVTVATVTGTIRGIRTEVPLSIEDGMRRDSVVNLDDILTIRISVLRDRLTTLTPGKMSEVEDAIKFALDIK
jgi:mRNA interferase MazF